MQISIKTAKSSYHRDIVGVLNGIFKLTDKEMDVLAKALEFQLHRAFSTQCRKWILEQMGFNSTHDVNNYVKRLKEKGVVQADQDEILRFNPLITKTVHDGNINVQFTNIQEP